MKVLYSVAIETEEGVMVAWAFLGVYSFPLVSRKLTFPERFGWFVEDSTCRGMIFVFTLFCLLLKVRRKNIEVEDSPRQWLCGYSTRLRPWILLQTACSMLMLRLTMLKVKGCVKV